jgi:hypothetical protein
MTEGVLRKTWGEQSAEATMGPDGWQSADAGFRDQLARLFPVVSTEAGVGWVIAFWTAAEILGAEVLEEPDAGEDHGPH